MLYSKILKWLQNRPLLIKISHHLSSLDNNLMVFEGMDGRPTLIAASSEQPTGSIYCYCIDQKRNHYEMRNTCPFQRGRHGTKTNPKQLQYVQNDSGSFIQKVHYRLMALMFRSLFMTLKAPVNVNICMLMYSTA